MVEWTVSGADDHFLVSCYNDQLPRLTFDFHSEQGDGKNICGGRSGGISNIGNVVWRMVVIVTAFG